MRWFVRPSAFAVSLALAVPNACTPLAAAASSALTPAQLRVQFTACGYGVDNPGSPSTGGYILVRDPDTDPRNGIDARIAMAIVYTDVPAAARA